MKNIFSDAAWWVSSCENGSESEQLTGNYEKEADSVQRYCERTQNLKSEEAGCDC